MMVGTARRLTRSRLVLAVIGVMIVVIAVVVAASTRVDAPDSAPPTAASADGPTRVVYGAPDVPDSVLASRELFARAPTVILTSAQAVRQVQQTAAQLAQRLRIPMFSFDAGTATTVRDELARLGARDAILPSGAGDDSLGLIRVPESSVRQAESTVAASDPPIYLVASAAPDALATVAAAGASGAESATGNPRDSSAAMDVLKARPAAKVVALGGEFGTATLLSERVARARAAPELPGGGFTVFPGRRLVALYGSPGSPSLGPLGRQGLDASIARAKKVAAEYDSASPVKVVPAFEIIVTVASASPGPGNNYTTIIDPAVIRPWVEAAGKAGIYVTLDLQPGRMDFLRQAKMYESLLKLPHVGLALDSEWRLGPNQVHLAQIGSVSAAEVNRTADWLAALVRDNGLPQKAFVLHEFDSDMLANRQAIDTSHPELATVIHADGHGTPPVKLATWRRLITDLPANVWMGWKNFYTEDHPTFTPAQTMRVAPAPWFVSYQ